MERNLRLKKSVFIVFLSMILTFFALMFSVYAESSALKSAKAKVDHLTYSLKNNYLGIKNQATWEIYIKEGRVLISKIPSSEKAEASKLTTQLDKCESLVKAVARINHVEKSLETNYHGIKNAKQWREYLEFAKIDLEKVDKAVFMSQYKELIDRMNKAEAVVKGIEDQFKKEYNAAYSLYEDAKKEMSLTKANKALEMAEALGTCDESDNLEKIINDLIVEINNNAIANGSQALKDAKAKIDHLTKSIKGNYLGIKNQAMWEVYIKEGRDLISKIPTSEKEQADALTVRLDKCEFLVKAVASINHVEKSMKDNYHGIKNAQDWRNYLDAAKAALEKVDKTIFKEEYAELVDRMQSAEAIVKKIEDEFQVEYDAAVAIYQKAKAEKNLELAKEALVKAEALGTCDRSNKLEEDIKALIDEIRGGSSFNNPFIKSVSCSFYYPDGNKSFLNAAIEFSKTMKTLDKNDFVLLVDGREFISTSAEKVNENMWIVYFDNLPVVSSVERNIKLKTISNPKSESLDGYLLNSEKSPLTMSIFSVQDFQMSEGAVKGINGDEKIEITFSESLDTNSVIKGWNGSKKTVSITFENQGDNYSSIEIPYIGRMDIESHTKTPYFKKNATFNATYEMTSSNVISISFNGPASVDLNNNVDIDLSFDVDNREMRSISHTYIFRDYIKY